MFVDGNEMLPILLEENFANLFDRKYIMRFRYKITHTRDSSSLRFKI